MKITPLALFACLGPIALAASSPHLRTPAAAVPAEPPTLVLKGPRLLEVRVCGAEDAQGITTLDKPDHYLVSGVTVTNLLCLGYGVSAKRVRGMDPARDTQIGVEVVGEVPAHRKWRLMADAAAAAVGCKAALKSVQDDVYTVSFGPKRPAPISATKCDVNVGDRAVTVKAGTLTALARALEFSSGLRFMADPRDGGLYDFKFELPEGVEWKDKAAIAAVEEQTGLKVTRKKGEAMILEVTWPD
jgi:hypothetical protein